MSKIGDTLQKAIEVLDAKGWCQHDLSNGKGAVCAFGAINMVLTGNSRWGRGDNFETALEIADALYDHLPEEYKEGCAKQTCVVFFNNHPRTTVDDVKDLFAKTIADEGVSIS